MIDDLVSLKSGQRSRVAQSRVSLRGVAMATTAAALRFDWSEAVGSKPSASVVAQNLAPPAPRIAIGRLLDILRSGHDLELVSRRW